MTGLAIKQAAIAACASIGLDFLLTEDLANGRARVVGDSDVVTVNRNSPLRRRRRRRQLLAMALTAAVKTRLTVSNGKGWPSSPSLLSAGLGP